MKRTILNVVAALIALFAIQTGFVGCEKRSESATTQSIGMLAPLTGNAARFGESQRNGVQLAIDQINAAAGLKGTRFNLVVEDTKTEPSTAITAFTRLAERGDLLAVFGSAASLDVPAYLPLVDNAKLPHLLPVAVLPKITEMGSKWTFRTALNDRIAATQMAEFAVETLHAPRIGLLIEDSAFGETGLFFKKRAEELGAQEIPLERIRRGDLDARAQLTKMKSLGVTHLQFWGYYAEYAMIAKQMQELQFSAQLMGNQAPVNDKTLELAGSAIEGALNICLFVPTGTSADHVAFVDRYAERYGAAPDTWAAQAYDSMMLLADAAKRGGTTPEALRDSLSRTSSFKGITGEISFDASGDAVFRGISVVKVESGRFVPFSK